MITTLKFRFGSIMWLHKIINQIRIKQREIEIIVIVSQNIAYHIQLDKIIKITKIR